MSWYMALGDAEGYWAFGKEIGLLEGCQWILDFWNVNGWGVERQQKSGFIGVYLLGKLKSFPDMINSLVDRDWFS
jgi:hypothetical protein